LRDGAPHCLTIGGEPEPALEREGALLEEHRQAIGGPMPGGARLAGESRLVVLLR